MSYIRHVLNERRTVSYKRHIFFEIRHVLPKNRFYGLFSDKTRLCLVASYFRRDVPFTLDSLRLIYDASYLSSYKCSYFLLTGLKFSSAGLYRYTVSCIFQRLHDGSIRCVSKCFYWCRGDYCCLGVVHWLFFHLRMIHSLNRKVTHYSGSVFSWDHFNSHGTIVVNSVTYWFSEWSLFVDGESWGVDEEVISRLVEDAIDSESREVQTMSRSRLVSTTWRII